MLENVYILFCEAVIGLAVVGTFYFAALFLDLVMPNPGSGPTYTQSLNYFVVRWLRAPRRLSWWFLVFMLCLAIGWVDLDCYHGHVFSTIIDAAIIALVFLCLRCEPRAKP